MTQISDLAVQNDLSDRVLALRKGHSDVVVAVPRMANTRLFGLELVSLVLTGDYQSCDDGSVMAYLDGMIRPEADFENHSVPKVAVILMIADTTHELESFENPWFPKELEGADGVGQCQSARARETVELV